MTLLGVLPLKTPLTDWHKIWHGWLRLGRHSVPLMACRSVQGVTPTKGWNVNGLCFFVCASAQLGVKPLDRFWRVISQNACFCKYCIPLGVRTRISLFRWVKIFQNRKNWPEEAFSSQNAKVLQWQYLQNSKSNQLKIWSATGGHEVLIQKWKN